MAKICSLQERSRTQIMTEMVSLYSILTAIACLLVLVDCYALRGKATGAEEVSHRNERLSDLVFLAPFAALFYTEYFWTSLIFTLPIILAVIATQWACHRKRWIDRPSELILLVPGSYLLTLIVYFIFFHDGFLAESNPTPEVIADRTAESSAFTWLGFWPYAIYAFGFLLAITRKSTDGICLSALLLILAITILPFFTGHYWWSMLAGFGLLLFTGHRAFSILESGSAGAFSLVSGLFYMISAFGSVLAYAFLY